MAYTPFFHMPIIDDPAAGVNTATYYTGITSSMTFSVTANANDTVTVNMSDHAHSAIFAMSGANLQFYPAGSTLPTASGVDIAGGDGSILLNTWAPDITKMKDDLPPGVPPVGYILYENVKESEVRSALLPIVQALPQGVLDAQWAVNNPTISPAAITDTHTNYLDSFLAGNTGLFVEGGTQIGQAGYVDITDPTSNAEIIIHFLDVDAHALSPILHFRDMPNLAGNTQWENHPMITSLSGQTVATDIYLQFEIFNLTTKLFETIPAGIEIKVMDYDDVTPNDQLASSLTDANGKVSFNFPNIHSVDENQPDLFFQAMTNGQNIGGNAVPADWSTKGWKAKEGEPGYYENFNGTRIGTATTPLIFRIGVDFHIKLEYNHPVSGTTVPAPTGTRINFGYLSGNEFGVAFNELDHFYCDKDGIVNAISFLPVAESNYLLQIPFKIKDATINLPEARMGDLGALSALSWVTFGYDKDGTSNPDMHWVKFDTTSVGTVATPLNPKTTDADRCQALFIMKTLYEWNCFIFHATNGDWNGIPNLVMHMYTVSGTSYSYPFGTVNISVRSRNNRGTIAHELTHQIMWNNANMSAADVLTYIGGGYLKLYHTTAQNSNSTHALIEGYSELIELIFDTNATPGFSFINLVDVSITGTSTANGSLPPPAFNHGNNVEGAFANALFEIYKDRVFAGVGASSRVLETVSDGNTLTNNPWINNAGFQARFLSHIWEPLKALSSNSIFNKTTTEFFKEMKSRNAADWHILQATALQFNAGGETIGLTALLPNAGLIAGGETIRLTGNGFIPDDSITILGTVYRVKTEVTFDGVLAGGVNVINTTTMECTAPPRAAGVVDVIVSLYVMNVSNATSVTLAGSYTYS